jgi:O-antigen/teichoic acid export membrane protein
MKHGRTATIHFLTQVATTVAGFLATFVIAVYLGSEGLGEYSVALSIGYYWLVFPAASVASAVTKRMSEGRNPAGYVSGGLLINATLAAVGAVTILAAGELLTGIVSRDREFMRILLTYDVEIAALYVAAIVFRTAVGVLEGQKRVAKTGVLKAIERVGRTGLQVAFLLAGLGVGAIAFGHAGSLLLVGVVGFLLSAYRLTVPSVAQLRSLADYAKYAWVGALQGRVFGWLDTIILSFFVNSSLIGIYEASWGIASMLAMVSSSISKTLFPEISDISTSDEYERIRHFTDEALAFSGIFIIPGLFGALLLGGRVLRFYRPEFGIGETVLVILVIAYAADVYASQLISVINAVDRPDAAFRINGVFIVANAALNVVLIIQFGWLGAAVATAASTALRAVVSYAVLRRIIDRVSLPLGEVGRQLGASLLMAGAILAVRDAVPPGRIGTLFVVGFGAMVYSATLLALSARVRNKLRLLTPDAVL